MYGYGKYPIRDFAPKRTSYSGKRTRFRPGDGPIGALLRGNVVRFPAMRKPPVETALAGWGGRIRTSEWRNQNPLPYHLATPHHGPAIGPTESSVRAAGT